MTRILFVCLGNICRSPLAEAIFNHQIREKKLQRHFKIASCGTANYHIGDPPDPRTIKNATRNGVKIDHLGRQFCSADFEGFDLILAMDKSNLANILRVPGAEKYADRVKLMRTFDTIDRGFDVPDPYYGTEKDFQEVFDILDRSIRTLIESFERPRTQNLEP
jgi:protein-tyrosine phosphatase